MNQVSPGGAIPSYTSRTVNYTDDKRLLNFAMGMGFGPQPEPTEATDEEVRAAIEAAEQTEVTDAEVRAIFSDEGPKGWTAREFEAIEA